MTERPGAWRVPRTQITKSMANNLRKTSQGRYDFEYFLACVPATRTSVTSIRCGEHAHVLRPEKTLRTESGISSVPATIRFTFLTSNCVRFDRRTDTKIMMKAARPGRENEPVRHAYRVWPAPLRLRPAKGTYDHDNRGVYNERQFVADHLPSRAWLRAWRTCCAAPPS